MCPNVRNRGSGLVLQGVGQHFEVVQDEALLFSMLGPIIVALFDVCYCLVDLFNRRFQTCITSI